MLQEIKNLIYSKYKPEDKIWFFFSLFDWNWKLLSSNGVASTDKTLEDMINLLYNWKIKPFEAQTKHIIFNIVNEITPQTDVQAFLQMDTKNNWVILAEINGNKTGIILPDTKGITTMQQAIAAIKVKYQLEWNVSISTFTTTKLCLDK